jgi:hypothetical protein
MEMFRVGRFIGEVCTMLLDGLALGGGAFLMAVVFGLILAWLR